jgi:hypothetical protein
MNRQYYISVAAIGSQASDWWTLKCESSRSNNGAPYGKNSRRGKGRSSRPRSSQTGHGRILDVQHVPERRSVWLAHADALRVGVVHATPTRWVAHRSDLSTRMLRLDDHEAMKDIRPGDSVTIVTRHGQKQTGRAVMRGPAGWVLNLGGPHGTPGIATEENTIAVRKARKHADDKRS